MSLPEIQETITADDPAAVAGSIRLWAQDGGGGVAYTNGGDTVGSLIRVTFTDAGALMAEDGITPLTLNPNSGAGADAIATPTGTVWQYEVRYPGVRTPDVRYLTVPDLAGPLQVADILTDEPGAILPSGAVAYVQAYAVAKAGDTMTGTLDLDGAIPLTIQDPGGTYDVVAVFQAPSISDAVVLLRDISNGVGLRKVFQINDTLGQPIAYVMNEGGLKVTDNIQFLRGSDLSAMVSMGWLDATNNLAPALWFGSIGSGGTTVVASSQTVTIDALKDAWVRLTDDAFIQSAKPWRFGTSSIVATGPVGPSAEPGVAISNNLGTGTVYVFRRAADTLQLRAVTIEHRGDLVPATNNTYDVGSASLQVKDVRLAGTIYKAGAALGLVDNARPAATTSNSAAETTLLTSTLTAAPTASHYRLRVYGNLVNNTGGAVTYQARVKLGAQTLVTSDALSLATSALTKQWDMDVDLWVYTDVAHQDAHLRWLVSNGSSNNAPNFPTGSAGGAIGGGLGTVDLSANPALVVSMQMGSASSSASFTCNSWYLERVS